MSLVAFEPIHTRIVPVRSPEFQWTYYGCREALAACFGVMAGFGSLFVYTFSRAKKERHPRVGDAAEANLALLRIRT